MANIILKILIKYTDYSIIIIIIIIIIVGVGRGRPNSNPSLKRTESGRTKRAAKITRNQEVTRRERPYTTVLSQRHVGTRSKLRDLN